MYIATPPLIPIHDHEHHYFTMADVTCLAFSATASTGSIFFAFDDAASAIFCSFSALILRMYAKRTINRISILFKSQLSWFSDEKEGSSLFLGHHEQTLNQDSLGDLRSDAFEQSQKSFMLDDI